MTVGVGVDWTRDRQSMVFDCRAASRLQFAICAVRGGSALQIRGSGERHIRIERSGRRSIVSEMTFRIEDSFPGSRAFLEMPALRIPSGWRIGWNVLCLEMADDLTGIGGSTLYNATNEGTRFNIDVAFRPEFDPDGAFHLTVTYCPWPRSKDGRRIKAQPLSFLDGQVVHTFETRSYERLIEQLEHWIARCSVWVVEGR